MTNIILTWASNINSETWPFYEVYFKSIRQQNIENCDFVCLTNKLDYEFLDKIVGNYHFVVEYVQTKSKKIFTERWNAYWQFLKKRNYDQVFLSDSRDVLFQDNPFFIPPDKEIVLTKEGILHKDSSWNMNEQFKFQLNLKENFSTYVNWPVVNAGVCCGKSKFIQDFCFLMWSNCLFHENCTDQAVLNFIISNQIDDPRIFLSDPEKDNYCLTGEAVAQNMLSFNAFIKNDFISKENSKFTIFHQWDRTNFAESILKKFIK